VNGGKEKQEARGGDGERLLAIQSSDEQLEEKNTLPFSRIPEFPRIPSKTCRVRPRRDKRTKAKGSRQSVAKKKEKEDNANENEQTKVEQQERAKAQDTGPASTHGKYLFASLSLLCNLAAPELAATRTHIRYPPANIILKPKFSTRARTFVYYFPA